MDILRQFSLLLFLLLLFCPDTRAGVAGDLDLDTGAGLGDIYNLGGGGSLKFDSDDLHFTYTKQLSPIDPSAISTNEKHTENWSAGFGQEVTEKFSLGLDYDQLSDDNELLYANGAKLTLGYDTHHLSFRFAKSEIDKNFLIHHPATNTNQLIHGAFVYQSTLEFSEDYTLTDKDTLTPSLSYSFFSPNVTAFSTLLSGKFSTSLSNFSDTLQNFEQWSLGFNYGHEYNSVWSSSAVLTISHLIVGKNPSIELNPAINRKWNEKLSSELGIDYVYIPGSPSYTLALKIKYSFEDKSKKDEEGGEENESENE